MKNYTVILIRSYLVSVNAENKENAMRFAEFFINDCKDGSNESERKQHKFSIECIKPLINDAIEATEDTD